MTTEASTGGWRRAGLAIATLVVFTAVTRLAAPWRIDITVDEAHHHLESWNHRYRTTDIYPLFLQRLDTQRRIPPKLADLGRWFYHTGALAQRSLIVLNDPQPPTFPVLAEIVEAVTHSNMLVMRLISVAASAAAVWLMYLAGVELRDRRLGLTMASLLAIGALGQIYAGIGRPYAMAQCAMVGLLWAFAHERRVARPTPRRFLLAALLAQSVQWFIWPVAGVLVAGEVIHRLRQGQPWRALLGQGWWYLLGSALLVGYMGLQLLNPTVSEQAERYKLAVILTNFGYAGPFAHLGGLGWGWLMAGLAVMAALTAGGAAVALWRKESLNVGRWSLLAALAVSILAPLAVAPHWRFLLTFMVVPIAFAGIGLCAITRADRITYPVLAVLLAGFLALWQLRPLDTYLVFYGDTHFPRIARQLAAELRPGDVWAAYPYHYKDTLYRFAALPEPARTSTQAELEAFLRDRPKEASTFILATEECIRNTPLLQSAQTRGRFVNGFLLLRLEPEPPPATGPGS
jgi:hypothetical protein